VLYKIFRNTDLNIEITSQRRKTRNFPRRSSIISPELKIKHEDTKKTVRPVKSFRMCPNGIIFGKAQSGGKMKNERNYRFVPHRQYCASIKGPICECFMEK
jgi:hypothetical protein